MRKIHVSIDGKRKPGQVKISDNTSCIAYCKVVKLGVKLMGCNRGEEEMKSELV